MSGRRPNAIPRETLRNAEEPLPTQVLAEDASHHRSRDRVDAKTVQSSPQHRIPGVGVNTGLGEEISVRRAAAEEPAFVLGLSRHSSTHPDLDPVPPSLAHPAVEGHHEVVGVRAGVDLAPNLRYP